MYDAPIYKESCGWQNPGRDPYTGSVEYAISQYPDLDQATKERLIKRIRAGNSDDIVHIDKNGVVGISSEYQPAIKGQFFTPRGTTRHVMCGYMDNSMWPAAHSELGYVYCEGDNQCILIVDTCKNPGRVTRIPVTPAFVYPPPGAGIPAEDTDSNGFVMPIPPATPLGDREGPLAAFDSPGAGLPPDASSIAEIFPVGGIGGAGPIYGGYGYPVYGGGGIGIPGNPGTPIITVPVSPIPEPPIYTLFVGGIALVLAATRKRK